MAEFDLQTIKKKMLRKYPAFGSTINGVKYQIVGNNHPVKTAATDGKTIYANAEYMAGLPEDEQVFTMAHEVCHIALRHIPRSKGKDARLWNIATDAVINQHLKKDGLPLSEGVVDMADALQYDAEELYEKLLAEKQQQQKQQQDQNQQGQEGKQGEQSEQQQGQGQGSGQEEQQEEQNKEKGQGQGSGQGQEQDQDENSQGSGQGEGEEQEDAQAGHDDHSMWEEAVKQEEEEKQKWKGSNSEQEHGEQEEQEISEKEAFEKNDEEKIKRAEEVMRKINGTRRGLDGDTQEVYFDDIGRADKAVANWKRMLVRTLEIEDEAWGHKFSDRASGYAARIEDVEYDEKAETEIILDTSGSVSVDLLKNFLRQVKTVLKNSTIRVGTFSNDFHGFVEIKRETDIDNLRIRVGGGTNFDAASRAFTKRKDVNKICFTDGQDGGDAEIRDKRKDIVWISFENPDFKPDNGKVLFVPKSQINLERRHEEPEMSL